MRLLDLSWPISEQMTPYKERKVVSFQHFKTFSPDKVRHSQLTLDSHAGTHVDAPAHFLEGGETIEQISLDTLSGDCTVLDLTLVNDKITKKDLQPKSINPGDIILLKTKNSELSPTAPFNYNFIFLDASGAAYLAEKKVKAVGIDYLGIERNQPGHETHRTLLGNGIPIIEGLRLGNIKEGRYTFLCLPLAVQGLEAAPARAVLMMP